MIPASFSGPDEDRVSHQVTLLAIVDFLRCSAEVFVPFRDYDEQSAASWYHYIHEKQRVAAPVTKLEQSAYINSAESNDDGAPSKTGAAMIVEMGHVLKHEIFKKSPTLRQLLRWLVRETMAARGGLVQSYTVSIYGIDRTKNSDAHAKSYCGVQIARLRKALEVYYAQCGRGSQLCLYILPDTHEVRIGDLQRAYSNFHDMKSGPLKM